MITKKSNQEIDKNQQNKNLEQVGEKCWKLFAAYVCTTSPHTSVYVPTICPSLRWVRIPSFMTQREANLTTSIPAFHPVTAQNYVLYYQ